MPRRRGRSPEARGPARSPLDLAIEAAWLAAAGLIPIVFSGGDWLVFAEQPKQLVLHAAALFIVAAWAVDSLFLSERSSASAGLPPQARLMAWAGRAPGRWAVIAAGAFAAVAVLSTLISPAPAVSIWGRDMGQLGYDLYSQLSLLVIFFAVALRLRDRGQARRLAFVVAIAGSLTAAYGLSQHFGWDPFGPGAGKARIYSSQLNPVFFGSFLTMTVAVTLALALSEGRRPGRAWWLPLGAMVLAAQLAALWLTGSRGPWLGSVAGIAAFLGIAVVWLDRRTLAGAVALVAIAVVGAVLIARIPSQGGAVRGLGDLGRAFTEVAKVVEEAVTPDAAPAAPPAPIEGIVPATGASRASDVVPGAAAGAAGDLFGDSSVGPSDAAVVAPVSGGGLSGRMDIWRGALKLATTWKREPADSTAVHLLRPALGFGPEMYHYSYPLTAGPQGVYMLITHAHNYLVQTLMELGVLGLLSFVALAALVLLAGLRFLRGRRAGGARDPWLTVLMAGLVAALAGRAVEQMSGVARIGDLAPFWALMALVVALGEMGGARAQPQPERRPRRGGGRERTSSWSAWAPPGAAVAIVALTVVVFMAKDVQQFRASRLGARAHAALDAGNGTAAFDLLRRAAGLAPDVELYPVQAHALLWNSARAETDDTRKRQQLETGYDLLAHYARRDPLSFTVRERLAVATVDLVEFGQTERKDEVAARYRDLAAALPSFPTIQALAANGLVIGDDPEDALKIAERAISMERVTGPQGRAWWARGEALGRLGRIDEARKSFEVAVSRDAEGEWGARAHLGLATIHELMGDPEAARMERLFADKIMTALGEEGGP